MPGVVPRHLRYPFEFRGDVVRARCLFHLFPPSVPLLGAALCSAGSLGSVPRRHRSYCGAPTSHPPRRASLRSPRRFLRGLPLRADGISPVPWRPLRCMPCSSTATRPRGHTPPGSRPEIAPRDAAFRPVLNRRLSSLPNFAARSHGLLARCLRFAPPVARDHARLASDFRRRLVGRDFNPLGRNTRFLLRLDLHRILRVRASQDAQHGLGGDSRREAEARGGRPFPNKHGLLDKSEEGGSVSRSTYRDDGRLMGTEDPCGGVTLFERDPRGRITQVTDPLGRLTKIELDSYGLPVKVLDPAGHETLLERDGAGNLVLVRDALGGTTSFKRDSRGLVTEVMEANGALTRAAYDAQGNRTSVTQPDGGVWQYTYDGLGRRLATKDPLGAVTAYAYSPRGDLLSRARRRRWGDALRVRRRAPPDADHEPAAVRDEAGLGRLPQAGPADGREWPRGAARLQRRGRADPRLERAQGGPPPPIRLGGAPGRRGHLRRQAPALPQRRLHAARPHRRRAQARDRARIRPRRAAGRPHRPHGHPGRVCLLAARRPHQRQDPPPPRSPSSATR